MPLEDYTRHQQGIIKRYYQNAPAIQLQRVSELVTELYLAEGKKRAKVWDSITTALTKLEVPADRIAHLRQADDPALLANLVKELHK
jgi:hypothetical protein